MLACSCRLLDTYPQHRGVASSEPVLRSLYPLNGHVNCAVFVDGHGDSEGCFPHSHLQGPLDLERQCYNTDVLPWGPHGRSDRASVQSYFSVVVDARRA